MNRKNFPINQKLLSVLVGGLIFHSSPAIADCFFRSPLDMVCTGINISQDLSQISNENSQVTVQDNGTIISSDIYAGYSKEINSNSVVVINNKLTFKDKSGWNESVYGGYGSGLGNVTVKDNTLTFNDQSEALYSRSIYGGYAFGEGSVAVSGNTLIFNDDSKIGSRYEMFVAGGSAAGTGNITIYDNTLNFNDKSIIQREVYGGYVEESSATTKIYNNKLNVNNNSRVETYISGGYARIMNSGNITINDNTLTFNDDSRVGSVSGGMVFLYNSSSGLVSGNRLIFNHNSSSFEFPYANGTDGSYSGISGGMVRSYGTGLGQVSNNTLTFNDEVILSSFIYGGYVSGNGDIIVSNNTLIFNDNSQVKGQAKKSVYGGYGSGEGTGTVIVSGNTLSLNNKSKIDGSVYGGYGSGTVSSSYEVTGNIINIYDSANISDSLYGGFIESYITKNKYDSFTNNTLNFAANPITLTGEIANFQNYNFIIDSVLDDPNTPFITANKIVLGSHVSNMSDTSQGLKSEIHVTEIAGDKEISNNTKYILMQANDINGLIENSNGAHLVESVAQQGLSRVYDVDTYIEGNNVVAVFEGSQEDNGVETNPQLDALLLGNLSGLMLLTRNGDLLSDNLFNAISEQNYQRGLTPFIIASGNHTKYETGRHSNIKSDGALTTIGLSWQDEQTTLGAFTENGWDSYTTFNGFTDVANVSGKGHNRFNGFGLYGHYDFMNGWYADATLRGGRLHTAFETDDLRNVETDERATYNLSTNYYGANLEGGYSIKFDPKNTVNLKAKYLWAQTDSQDLTIASEQIHFNKLDSHRIQFHIENLNQITPELTFISSLGYEHEFTGKAQGHASSHGFFEMDDQSVKGGTGISTLGLRYNPSQYKNLTLDVKATGYIGKREGGIGMLKVDYAF